MRFFVLSLLQSLFLASAVTANPTPDFKEAIALVKDGDNVGATAAFMALAEAGNVTAQANLAVLYASGIGVPQNDLEAAYWAWLARLSGEDRAAAICDQLLTRLTPELNKILAQRLTEAFTTRADSGDRASLLALGRVAAEVHQPPRVDDAFVWYIVATAFDVQYASVFRDLLARDIDGKARSAAQQSAMEKFNEHCQRTLTLADHATCKSVEQ